MSSQQQLFLQWLQLLEAERVLRQRFTTERDHLRQVSRELEPAVLSYLQTQPQQQCSLAHLDPGVFGPPGTVRILPEQPVDLTKTTLRPLLTQYMHQYMAHTAWTEEQLSTHAENATHYCWDNRERRPPARPLGRNYSLPRKRRRANIDAVL